MFKNKFVNSLFIFFRIPTDFPFCISRSVIIYPIYLINIYWR